MQIWLLQQFVKWIVPFVVTGPLNWSWTNNWSRYHTFFLVLCWLVVVCFYCCNNSSENIVNSLKIFRIYFDYFLEGDCILKHLVWNRIWNINWYLIFFCRCFEENCLHLSGQSFSFLHRHTSIIMQITFVPNKYNWNTKE